MPMGVAYIGSGHVYVFDHVMSYMHKFEKWIKGSSFNVQMQCHLGAIL